MRTTPQGVLTRWGDGSVERAAQGLRLRNVMVRPTATAAAPPTSIQTALSVGDPEKNRETSELKELVAVIPITIRTTPPTRMAMERILFMMSK